MKRAAREASPLQLQLFPAPEQSAPIGPAAERAAVAGPASEPLEQPAAVEPASKAALDALWSGIFGGPAAELRDRLQALMPGRLGTVTLTENRSTIVSARENGGRLDVRIQRCFAAAPEEILAAVAAFLTSGKRSRGRRVALAAIREYFRRHQPQPVVRRRRTLVLRPVGQTLDLRQVRDAINGEYFDGEIDVHITWGRALPRRRRRGRHSFSVRLGTYNDRDNVVSIHRCLDRAGVPRYVVESVVYHEMLHAALPPVTKNGRRRIHTPEFRRRERRFPDYQRAERWLESNLKRLL